MPFVSAPVPSSANACVWRRVSINKSNNHGQQQSATITYFTKHNIINKHGDDVDSNNNHDQDDDKTATTTKTTTTTMTMTTRTAAATTMTTTAATTMTTITTITTMIDDATKIYAAMPMICSFVVGSSRPVCRW